MANDVEGNVALYMDIARGVDGHGLDKQYRKAMPCETKTGAYFGILY